MALDIVDVTDRYKGGQHTFHLDADAWRRFRATCPLAWTKTRFGRSTRPLIPKVRGIYVFSVEHTPSAFPAHGYLLYVGISGRKPGANLHKRYGAYLRDQARDGGRPAVTYMLRKFARDLHFHYCAVPDPSVDLDDLERRLIAAIDPPVNNADLPAWISGARKASF